MTRIVTRRDLLRLAGGSALGIFLTPLPWKLLDDSAIWTQNWSLVPPVPRGRVSTKRSACTLCPANCPVKARCVAGMPVALTGVPGHPFEDGALCALGLAAHHLPFHPSRIDRPWRRVHRGTTHAWEPAAGEEVLAMVARCAGASTARAPIAVLDRRPGRCVSGMYRDFLDHTGRGSYLVSGSSEETALRALRRRSSPDPGPLAYDLANARVVVSFGAPLLEGWGSPPVTRRVFKGNPRPRLIQVGSRTSETSRRADLTLAIRPGSSEALALGLGALLLASGERSPAIHEPDLDAYRARAARRSLSQVVTETGVPESAIIEAAHIMRTSGPVVVIDSPDPAGGPHGSAASDAIAALNVIAGAMHERGGIVRRTAPAGIDPEPPDDRALCDVPDGSLGLLIVDDAGSGLALPEEAIRRTVREGDGLVLAFSPYLAGAALAADVVVPVAAPFETPEEVYSPATDPRWAMGIAAPLYQTAGPVAGSPAGRVSFLKEVLRALGVSATELTTTDDLLGRRMAVLASSGGSGQLAVPAAGGVEMADPPADPAELRSAMLEGAWFVSSERRTGETAERERTIVTLLPEASSGTAGRAASGASFAGDLLLLPVGWKAAVGNAAVPPLTGKLYQESDLRRPSGHASVNPDTARAAGVGRAGRARVVTSRGSMEIALHVDARMMPGVIELWCGPATAGWTGEVEPLSLVAIRADGSWDATPARLEAL